MNEAMSAVLNEADCPGRKASPQEDAGMHSAAPALSDSDLALRGGVISVSCGKSNDRSSKPACSSRLMATHGYVVGVCHLLQAADINQPQWPLILVCRMWVFRRRTELAGNSCRRSAVGTRAKAVGFGPPAQVRPNRCCCRRGCLGWACRRGQRARPLGNRLPGCATGGSAQ